MSRLLQQAASPEILDAAWRDYRGDSTPWRAGISRADMEKRLFYHLAQLAEELRSGVYQPDPVRFCMIHKGDGGQRLISVYSLRDKVAQRAVLQVIEPLGERVFHPDSFAYRTGRSIDMVMARIMVLVSRRLSWIADSDIERCFESIPRGRLLERLQALLYDEKSVRLIERWLKAGCKPERGSRAAGIPQGSVLSPFLCNLYLTRWDHDLAARKIHFVRFADDFLLFSRTRSEAEAAMGSARKSLHSLGLKLNEGKTQVALCSPKIQFLGRRLPAANKGGSTNAKTGGHSLRHQRKPHPGRTKKTR